MHLCGNTSCMRALILSQEVLGLQSPNLSLLSTPLQLLNQSRSLELSPPPAAQICT